VEAVKLDPEPTLGGVLRLVGRSFRFAATDRVAQLVGSAILLVMLWGTHGKVDLLERVIPGWTGPGGPPGQRARLIEGIPWDQEWIAFGVGAVLLIVIPCCLIRFAWRESPLDYGLGLPRRGTWRFTLLSMAFLAAFGFPSLYLAARDPQMRATYPFFRDFGSLGDFVAYELGYLVFFVVIEFIFRGYLLFGLYRAQVRRVGAESATIGPHAILLSMLSYTAWHLGKPLAEQWGTPAWGVITGAMVLASGTIWHVVLVHWGMNVLMDYLVWTSS
jgi:membrane protease YdiL (CAAX protease family)